MTKISLNLTSNVITEEKSELIFAAFFIQSTEKVYFIYTFVEKVLLEIKKKEN